jgi:hypothetical protein
VTELFYLLINARPPLVRAINMLGILMLGVTGVSAATLSAYNVDPGFVSVSGLSSGGSMSVQLGVAYSDTFKIGFGVFAGSPYDCARNQSVSYCDFEWAHIVTAI